MADYNINDVTRRVQFTGNTGLGPFAFSFEILAETDVAVYKNTTLLTLTTDYTVTINANGTGSITLTGTGDGTALISSDVLTIIGARNLERTTDFVTGGDLLASSLNEQLDSQVVMLQQLDEKLARSLRYDSFDQFTSAVMPAKADRLGKYLQFNSTTGNPEAGPDSTDVTTLADVATDIATLADIEDGTDATDAIQTVAGISSNVTTVAGISSNVTSVAGNASNINAVAADATDIGTVATNISSVNTVAGNISEVVAVANDLNEAVSEVETVANDLNEAVSEIETVAASISNVDSVGTNISNVNTVAGIDGNVTTVAGISANVTTVAGISSSVSTVAGISANVTTVAGISADVSTVAGDSASIQAVAADATDIGTVATDIANVNTVAGSIANVNTTAANITGVNSFAERYRVGATDPVTSLDEGDLFFNTTDNSYKFYDGSSWQTVNVSGIGSVLDDATPQLGGNLDLNSSDITGTGNINITGTLTATSYSGDGSALTGIEAFASGTAMLFAQTTAPTGWTKSTTHDDKALRVVSGTASSGGTSAFTTAFGTPSVSGTVAINGAPDAGTLAVSVSGNVNVGNTTLSINQIPSHSHGYSRSSGNFNATSNANGAGNSVKNNSNTGNKGNNGAHNHSANHNISGNLSGAPGSGDLGASLTSATASIDVQYVDVIIATKD